MSYEEKLTLHEDIQALRSSPDACGRIPTCGTIEPSFRPRLVAPPQTASLYSAQRERANTERTREVDSVCAAPPFARASRRRGARRRFRMARFGRGNLAPERNRRGIAASCSNCRQAARLDAGPACGALLRVHARPRRTASRTAERRRSFRFANLFANGSFREALDRLSRVGERRPGLGPAVAIARRLSRCGRLRLLHSDAFERALESVTGRLMRGKPALAALLLLFGRASSLPRLADLPAVCRAAARECGHPTWKSEISPRIRLFLASVCTQDPKALLSFRRVRHDRIRHVDPATAHQLRMFVG